MDRRRWEDRGRFVLCYADGAPDRATKFTPDTVEADRFAAGFATAETSQGSDRENGG